MQISLMNKGKDNFKPMDVTSLQDLGQYIVKETYSLGSFKNDHRTNNDFISSELVGLDFDGGMTLDEAKIAFKDYTHIIGTTRNHNKAKDGVISHRFRVILKLDKVVTTAEDYKATVLALLEKYPAADRQCSDAARMFFPCTEIVSYNYNGLTVEAKKYVRHLSAIPPVAENIKGNLSKNTLSFIAFGATSGWNGVLFKAAKDCHEQGYTQQECIETLKPATLKFFGDFDATDLKTIASAYNKDPKYPPRKVEGCFNFQKPHEYKASAEGESWLVDGLLIAGGLSIFAGMPKSGKSTLSRQLAAAVVKGTPFLDRPVSKGKVLYLALEEQEGLLIKQFKNVGITPEDDILLHVGPMNVGSTNDDLVNAIEGYGATLVVIDTLLLYANFDNPNDYNEAYKKLSAIRNIARQTNAHIICLHHQNKGEDRGANSVLGSTAIQGAVDATMILNGMGRRESYRRFSSFQRGGKRFNGQELKYVEDADIYELSFTPDPEF